MLQSHTQTIHIQSLKSRDCTYPSHATNAKFTWPKSRLGHTTLATFVGNTDLAALCFSSGIVPWYVLFSTSVWVTSESTELTLLLSLLQIIKKKLLPTLQITKKAVKLTSKRSSIKCWDLTPTFWSLCTGDFGINFTPNQLIRNWRRKPFFCTILKPTLFK